MLKLHEEKVLPYSHEELFNLVLDVESYHTFLPFCISSKKISGSLESGQIMAEVGVKFGFTTNNYTSLIKPRYDNKGAHIDIIALTGPFKHLRSTWDFTPVKNGTNVSFSLDFEFDSLILNKMMSGYLKEAYAKMMNAFEERARSVYAKNSVA